MPVLPATTGPFAGMSEQQLRAMLAEAQAALHALMVGGKAVKIAFAMGDGSRSVEYTPGNVNALRQHITALNRALGQGGRRAIGVAFG